MHFHFTPARILAAGIALGLIALAAIDGVQDGRTLAGLMILAVASARSARFGASTTENGDTP